METKVPWTIVQFSILGSPLPLEEVPGELVEVSNVYAPLVIPEEAKFFCHDTSTWQSEGKHRVIAALRGWHSGASCVL